MMSVLLVLSSSVLLAHEAEAAQRIAQEPADVTVRQGDTALLKCRVEDQEGPLQWTKDDFGLGTDRALNAFPRYSMVGSSADGEYNLEIREAELEDDGQYRCQIGSTRRQKAAVSARARLTVLQAPQPPTLLNKEDLIQTTEDRAFTITCAAQLAKPSPKITWVVATNSDGSGEIRTIPEKDKTREGLITEHQDEVENGKGLVNTRSSLRYSPRRGDDGAFLVCVVRHEAVEGKMTASSLVRVEYSPRVRVELDPEETEGGKSGSKLKEGERATLLCTVDAKPATGVRYAWKRDGSIIPHEHTRRLRIKALQNFHHGAQFECEATNAVGSGRGSFRPSVIYGPRMPTGDSLRPLPVDVGDSVTLSCPADGNPTPVVRWTKVGAPDNVLAQGENYSIPAIKAWQAGNYQCQATVPGFQPATAAYAIYLNGPPRVLMAPVVEGAEGDSVEIICDIRGFPSPTSIDWWKGHRRLEMKEHPNYEMRQLPQAEGVVSILSMRSTLVDDFDIFNCSATNPRGSHSATTRLLVANPFPLYILIPCLVAGCVLLLILILCLVLCSRRRLCSGKSSHRSGDSHSDVTVKVEELNGVPINSYYATEIYSPSSIAAHPSELNDPFGKDYLPIPQDNPDLDVLPPPYSNYAVRPNSSLYHPHQYGAGGPPSTSTFRDPQSERLVHVTYVDEGQLMDDVTSPILYTDGYGNIVASDYGERYGAEGAWAPSCHAHGVPLSQAYHPDPNVVYYPSSTAPGLEPVAELPTPVSERGDGLGFAQSPQPASSSSLPYPTTTTAFSGLPATSSHSPLNDSGLPTSSLNSTNV